MFRARLNQFVRALIEHIMVGKSRFIIGSAFKNHRKHMDADNNHNLARLSCTFACESCQETQMYKNCATEQTLKNMEQSIFQGQKSSTKRMAVAATKGNAQ
jgi:hypothetical protein